MKRLEGLDKYSWRIAEAGTLEREIAGRIWPGRRRNRHGIRDRMRETWAS
jgi:hypothetical protein